MQKLKDVNFWIIYFIFLLILTSFFFFVMYMDYKESINKYKRELSSLNKITVQNTISTFNQQESILRILGKNLLDLDVLSNPENGRKMINDMITVNKGLVGFGLAKYTGELILVSSLPPNSKLPNLLNSEKSRDSFLQARDKISMSLGRTYKVKILNRWGIPIRIAIKDDKGNIPLVMTAGIAVDGGDTTLKIKELPKNILIKLIRKNDGFIQFQSDVKNDNYQNVFYKKYSKKEFSKIDEIGINGGYLDLGENEKRTLNSILFIKEYDLYSVVSIPYKEITKDFSNRFILFLLLYIFIVIVLYYVFKYNINIQEKTKKSLEYIANHDALTDLPNRYALNEELKNRLKKEEQFYLMFLDLDNFKNVNDVYGHIIGDELLKKVSSILKTMIKENDFLSRQGGDEFVIIYSNNNLKALENLSLKIIEKLNEAIKVGKYIIYTGTSIGISKIENSDEDSISLLNKADLALYKAKESKNSYFIFTNKIYESLKLDLEIENHLRKAIENEEFFLVYQPKIDSKTLELIGVEALIRWKNPVLGFISPEKFISIAEKSDLIIEIGKFVFKKAQEEVLEVYKKANKEFNLSINVSPRQISSNKNIEDFKGFVFENNEIEKKLILEVTEGVFIKNSDNITNLLKEFRNSNIGISLDDFGTGYSSLSVLSKLPITELKIDKFFIQNMLNNKNNLMLVKSIINISKEMNLKVVAEGVEEKRELEILNEYKCDTYQGYYFSKPLLKDDLTKFIENKKENNDTCN